MKASLKSTCSYWQFGSDLAKLHWNQLAQTHFVQESEIFLPDFATPTAGRRKAHFYILHMFVSENSGIQNGNSQIPSVFTHEKTREFALFPNFNEFWCWIRSPHRPGAFLGILKMFRGEGSCHGGSTIPSLKLSDKLRRHAPWEKWCQKLGPKWDRTQLGLKHRGEKLTFIRWKPWIFSFPPTFRPDFFPEKKQAWKMKKKIPSLTQPWPSWWAK